MSTTLDREREAVLVEPPSRPSSPATTAGAFVIAAASIGIGIAGAAAHSNRMLWAALALVVTSALATIVVARNRLIAALIVVSPAAIVIGVTESPGRALIAVDALTLGAIALLAYLMRCR